jgi:hypothetical protein
MKKVVKHIAGAVGLTPAVLGLAMPAMANAAPATAKVGHADRSPATSKTVRSSGTALLAFADWLRIAVNGRLYSGRAPLTASATARKLDAHWSVVFAGSAAQVVTIMQRRLPAMRASFLQARSQQLAAVKTLVEQAVAHLEQ